MIDYYFMVELETIPKYNFLTFFSQTICSCKWLFALVSNKQMGWLQNLRSRECILRFPQWRYFVEVLYHIKNSDLSMAEYDVFQKSYRKKSENIFRELINKFKRSMEWHCSDYK